MCWEHARHDDREQELRDARKAAHGVVQELQHHRAHEPEDRGASNGHPRGPSDPLHEGVLPPDVPGGEIQDQAPHVQHGVLHHERHLHGRVAAPVVGGALEDELVPDAREPGGHGVGEQEDDAEEPRGGRLVIRHPGQVGRLDHHGRKRQHPDRDPLECGKFFPQHAPHENRGEHDLHVAQDCEEHRTDECDHQVVQFVLQREQGGDGGQV
mmetsp:Transcript_112071/g.317379  ORF Transcript_112071/g.317379 Transcript_112071/m.317379 type:complete len:211 (+) Transcript_112071:218-850(+)